jgi:hypothetical protein
MLIGLKHFTKIEAKNYKKERRKIPAQLIEANKYSF